MNNPSVSVVIPALNEGSWLERTVESIAASSPVPDEIIIVDDGGGDGSVDRVERAWTGNAGALLVHRQPRSGIARARNAGAALARGDMLVFLDAHCLVEPAWLGALSTALAGRDAIAAPVVADIADGRFRGCGARIIRDDLTYQWLTGGGDAAEIGVAPGGCLALWRSTFERLGGFDQFREFGVEDVEFSIRAWRQGVTIVAAPDALIHHWFRPKLPYRTNPGSRAYNVARTALVHFCGEDARRCLTALVGHAGADLAVVDAVTGDWLQRKAAIDRSAIASGRDFLARFASW